MQTEKNALAPPTPPTFLDFTLKAEVLTLPKVDGVLSEVTRGAL